MVDPVFEEVDRILIIVQNDDGSWGTSESVDERLYHTGWVLRTLRAQRIDSPLERTQLLLRNGPIADIEKRLSLSNFSHARKLCGLVMSLSYVFEKQLWHSREKFLEGLKQVLDFAESRSWMTSQLAAYVSYFLKDIPEVAQYAKRAEDTFAPYVPGSTINAFSALGSIQYLKRVILSDTLADGLKNMADDEIAHLLVAISSVGSLTEGQNATALGLAKERLIETIQRRQLTELDRVVSKEILDILLLLRARLSKTELQDRLRKIGSSIYLRNVESTDSAITLVTEIPSKGLPEVLGRIDLVVLSAYVYATNMSGEKIVHLIKERDFQRIKPFFENYTLPIPSARLLGYEFILGCTVLAAGAAGLVWLGFILSTTFSSLPLVQQVTLTVVSNATVFVGALAILGRIFRHGFPELFSALAFRVPRRIASGLIRRILVGR